MHQVEREVETTSLVRSLTRGRPLIVLLVSQTVLSHHLSGYWLFGRIVSARLD